MSNQFKFDHLIFYPFILIMGYVLGTAYFPPKTVGIFLTPHLLVDESLRYRSAYAGNDSFHHLMINLYGDFVSEDSSTWMEDQLPESFGIQILDGNEPYRCSEGELSQFKKQAVASLWYSPNFLPNTDLNPHFNDDNVDQDQLSEDKTPVTILFLPVHQNSGQLFLKSCDNYLIFIPKAETP